MIMGTNNASIENSSFKNNCCAVNCNSPNRFLCVGVVFIRL